MPNQSKLTKVRSIRASSEFWNNAGKVASEEKTDVNKLIVKVVSNYCKEVKNGTGK